MYYEVENIILAAAIGIVANTLIARGAKLAGFGIFTVAVVGQTWVLLNGTYGPLLKKNLKEHPLIMYRG